jgi:hypothetical protein
LQPASKVCWLTSKSHRWASKTWRILESSPRIRIFSEF